MSINAQEIIFYFVGGLGLFLFGLKFMSEALQSVAGDKMRTILERGTKNPVRGVFTGILVTGIIQSSTATTVLTVGLVNAQLLTLRQAIGVIMGANIGTTVTAYLIGFNLKDYALPILAAGAFTFIFSRRQKAKIIGQAIMGFGCLFFGLTIMGAGMQPLKDLPFFINLVTSIDNNSIIGVLIGIIFTAVVQSSSATIGVLQELGFQQAISYSQTVPILFGDNIGTTITAVLAAVGAGVAARRAALTHVLFNVIGASIFLPLFHLGIFQKIVIFFTNYLFVLLPGFAGSWETLNIKLQIAQTHAVFNISNTIIQLPMIGLLTYVVVRLVPDSGEETLIQFRPQYLDKRFLNNPSVALSQAARETFRMGQLVKESFANAVEYFEHRNKELRQKAVDLEEVIDILEREITDYTVLASEKSLSAQASTKAYIILRSLKDLERIGDHCENIVEQADYATKYQVSFSGEASEELAKITNLTEKTLHLALEALEHDNQHYARQVIANEQLIDDMQEEFRKAHIRRLNERICNGSNGAVFLDLLANLERISDHCRNIAVYVLREK
ncbi:MAG: Na/Pi cotransporter family protein [Syntrophomonadaceae bacterium]|jgi:phosphate:Na+ symporter